MNTKNSTKSKDYADYYLKKFNIWYRKVLPVDVPFSFIAKRACCGKILDIGCGPGRYLKFFKNAVGVDHNKIFIEYAKKNGFEAYLINEFKHKFDSLLFDTLLFSHILEHMNFENAILLIKEYLPYLNKNGRIVIVLPDGKSYQNDPTHVLNFTPVEVKLLAKELGLTFKKVFYHPFPKAFGKWLVNDAIYILNF